MQEAINFCHMLSEHLLQHRESWQLQGCATVTVFFHIDASSRSWCVPAQRQPTAHKGHTLLPHGGNTALLLITAYDVVSQNVNVFFHDQVVAASIPGLKCVLISAVKTWSNSCSITAHSAMLQKQKKCLITISTSHVLGVKSLEVREWKGKETENSLVQCVLETAIKWRGGKGLSKQDAFRLEWSSHCEARNGM